MIRRELYLLIKLGDTNCARKGTQNESVSRLKALADVFQHVRIIKAGAGARAMEMPTNVSINICLRTFDFDGCVCFSSSFHCDK